ncbi:hypothetical protein C8J56DRAFT_1163966 [Mycena floridula]|nr:hypothetical protein C8J56DRAFT_1163966 [Mycena floridula]
MIDEASDLSSSQAKMTLAERLELEKKRRTKESIGQDLDNLNRRLEGINISDSTATGTLAPNATQGPLGLGASGMNSAPSLGMGSGMDNAGSGMGAVPGMGNSGMGSDLFSQDFINSVADQLDFDPSMFMSDGYINFERDFGQWFSPDDISATGTPSLGSGYYQPPAQWYGLPQQMPPGQHQALPSQNHMGLRASGMNSAPSLGMGSGMGNAGAGVGAVPAMDNSGMVLNRDIKFERDFGEWFTPDDVPEA